jgi:hypothetical protein
VAGAGRANFNRILILGRARGGASFNRSMRPPGRLQRACPCRDEAHLHRRLGIADARNEKTEKPFAPFGFDFEEESRDEADIAPDFIRPGRDLLLRRFLFCRDRKSDLEVDRATFQNALGARLDMFPFTLSLPRFVFCSGDLA